MRGEALLELLRVALGTRPDLSRRPTAEQWAELYDEAKRQSVLGVCLEAVSRDGGQWADQRGMPIELKLRWIGRGEQIADENRLLNRQCQQLTQKLTQSGRWNCILKGQGLARLYPHPEWRQSGDIDVWVPGPRRQLVEMTRRVTGRCEEVTYHHTDFRVFDETPVELHFTPSWMFNPRYNRRLQRWFQEHRQTERGGDFPVPTREFNRLFVLLHIFRHVFDEGVGLRQIIDYFFVLRDADDHGDLRTDLEDLGLLRFARGLMWLMGEALAMPREWMVAEPDERLGRWLLEEVMEAGNFGRYDRRNEGIRHDSPRLVRLRWRLRTSVRRIWYFPSEALWEVPWRVWQYLWRWRNGYL